MDAPFDDVLEGVSDVEIIAEEQPIPPSRRTGSAPEPARRQPSRRATTEAARQEYHYSRSNFNNPRKTKNSSLAIIDKFDHTLHESSTQSICLSAVKVQHLINTANGITPKNYKQAVKSPEFEKGWKQACEDGIKKLDD